MITKIREQFNASFSEEKYQSLKDAISRDFDYEPKFRIAETPFFISKTLKTQLIEGCSDVIAFIKREDFKQITNKALESNQNIPNEGTHTNFITIDFGICEENGQTIPKLIEVQGFPSLFNFQNNLFEKFIEVYPFLGSLTPYLDGLTSDEYVANLRNVICNNHPSENVILLEIEPEKQSTRIDFDYCTRDLGVSSVCVTKVFKKGNQLFYRNKNEEEILVKRIYNRVIFDELNSRNDLKLQFSFTDDLEVEWAGHPNWFFRISKFILPLLKGKYFIETTLLSDLDQIPADLENYVLKPLFSFSGEGVIFHVSKSDIEAVADKENYILQKKVHYLPILQAPDQKIKVEIRMLYTWKDDEENPILLTNLVRLSRGEMIGVKYNQDKDWVGGTIGLFEN